MKKFPADSIRGADLGAPSRWPTGVGRNARTPREGRFVIPDVEKATRRGYVQEGGGGCSGGVASPAASTDGVRPRSLPWT